jgi:hypothetical protein
MLLFGLLTLLFNLPYLAISYFFSFLLLRYFASLAIQLRTGIMAWVIFSFRPESPLCFPLFAAAAEDNKQRNTSSSVALGTELRDELGHLPNFS